MGAEFLALIGAAVTALVGYALMGVRALRRRQEAQR